jgi:hypothetical protein
MRAHCECAIVRTPCVHARTCAHCVHSAVYARTFARTRRTLRATRAHARERMCMHVCTRVCTVHARTMVYRVATAFVRECACVCSAFLQCVSTVLKHQHQRHIRPFRRRSALSNALKPTSAHSYLTFMTRKPPESNEAVRIIFDG